MSFSSEIKMSCRVLTPENWSNDKRGNYFEQIAEELLKKQRYRIKERVRFTGMEIDLIADHIDTNQRAFVECKFLKDPFSANVVDLLIGQAVRKNIKIAYLFSTSNPGKEAKGVLDELQTAQPAPGTPKIAFVGPDSLVDMFVDVYNLKSIPESILAKESFAGGCLTFYPDLPPFWVFEEHKDGIPYRAILLAAKNKLSISEDSIKDIFKKAGIYQGLELKILDEEKQIVENDKKVEFNETVSKVAEAESLDDYRPCRPEYFIGRYNTQREIWKFLDNVRKKETSTRVLALTAQSGFGKSSLIIKLASRFKNKNWKNKFFLYPIDSRSAKGPLFVPKAIKAAFESVTNCEFAKKPQEDIKVDSTEGMLKSSSIQKILNDLKITNRVLIIFFDQFEELFTKDDLLTTFDAFKKLAFEASSEQSNLVIGFSWRTGITLSDDNPAYHVWHELSDHRISINLGEFESGESSQMVGQFEKALDQKIINPLRRRLLEQGRGMPWLLKKICIHIYHEIKKGEMQSELVIKRLNVSSLFDADTSPLTAKQQGCLKYIAQNSPADILDVLDKFDQETINRLINRRLIIRAGQKFAVYWDIFRDFLVDGVVPIIPWTYVPQVALKILIKSFLLVSQYGPITIDELTSKLEYAPKTVNNIVGDLQGFLLAVKDQNGKLSVVDDLTNADLDKLAEYIENQLNGHVVLDNLFKNFKKGQKFSTGEFQKIVKDSYSSISLKTKTIEVYANRFIPFLRFSGAIEYKNNKFIRPISKGKDFGVSSVINIRRRKTGGEGGYFMGTASPQKVIMLAESIKKKNGLPKKIIMQSGLRNAAADLIALNLAVWKKTILLPKNNLLDESICETHKILANKSRQSEFLKAALEVENRKKISGNQLGYLISQKIGREWSQGSQIRYGNAARRWIAFFDLG